MANSVELPEGFIIGAGAGSSKFVGVNCEVWILLTLNSSVYVAEMPWKHLTRITESCNGVEWETQTLCIYEKKYCMNKILHVLYT